MPTNLGGAMTSDDGQSATLPTTAPGPAVRKPWVTPRVIVGKAHNAAATGTSPTTFDAHVTVSTGLFS